MIETEFNSLAEKAKELESKGLYRRADKLWLEAMECTNYAALREKALKNRLRCLRKSGNNNYSKSWNFPGSIDDYVFDYIEVIDD